MNSRTLSLNDLSAYRADRNLFQSLNCQLSSGAALQILGSNGSGKSTLLKIIAGLRQPDSGSIDWQGEAIALQLAEYQVQIAYLGHRLGLKLSLSVLENLVSCGISRAEILVMLKAFGLEQYSAALVAHLSQGQKQRLALLRVYLSNKKIWILDEPFAALDQASFEYMQNILQQHLQQGGLFILSSHRALLFSAGVQTIHLDNSHA